MLDMIPYYAGYERKGKVDFFKLFGCITYTHLLAQNRKEKFDEKGGKHIFIS